MRYFLVCLLLIFSTVLVAQNILQINGINEAEFVYRTRADSLNTYFQDKFGFNLLYKDFRFGMKFISHLPKYSNQQNELIGELNPNQLNTEWKELYAGIEKEDFFLQVGTTEESFGKGILFRSYEDKEFDEDHRLNAALFRYDGNLKTKAFYGAINSLSNRSKYDLAFGLDAQYPVVKGLNLGASALGYRNLGVLNHYNFRDVFGGRLMYNSLDFSLHSEYGYSKEYHLIGGGFREGHAIFVDGEYQLSDLLLGAAFKHYLGFDYRLNDIPVANYHNETLSDSSPSGADEIGWQVRASYPLFDRLYLSADYAEAFDSKDTKNMNDLYLEAELELGAGSLIFGYSHIEKLHKGDSWQKEFYPSLAADTPLANFKLEFKTIEKKQGEEEIKRHYEPALQTDFGYGDLSVSLGLSSSWQGFDKVIGSRYSPNIELKYPVFKHTDLILFGGKEAGGKVCRNGVCRYVAPFEGFKAELISRF